MNFRSVLPAVGLASLALTGCKDSYGKATSHYLKTAALITGAALQQTIAEQKSAHRFLGTIEIGQSNPSSYPFKGVSMPSALSFTGDLSYSTYTFNAKVGPDAAVNGSLVVSGDFDCEIKDHGKNVSELSCTLATTDLLELTVRDGHINGTLKRSFLESDLTIRGTYDSARGQFDIIVPMNSNDMHIHYNVLDMKPSSDSVKKDDFLSDIIKKDGVKK